MPRASIITSLTCWLFGHRMATRAQFLPSITADTITEFRSESVCARCGHTERTRWLWDGSRQDFDDAPWPEDA